MKWINKSDPTEFFEKLVLGFNLVTSNFQHSFVKPICCIIVTLFAFNIIYVPLTRNSPQSNWFLALQDSENFPSWALIENIEIFDIENLMKLAVIQRDGIAFLVVSLISSLIFMSKHALNRYTNYKW